MARLNLYTELKTLLLFPILPRTILRKKIPYFSELESPELVDKVLDGTRAIASDPLWKQSGAKSKEEYVFWAPNLCGMACLKMVLANTTGIIYPLVTLGKECEHFGGYKVHENRIDGLFYDGCKRFVENSFPLKVNIARRLSIRRIIYEIGRGNYVIASVDRKIRLPDKRHKGSKKGGHLVLITGYDIPKRLIFLHNSFGIHEKSQVHFKMSLKNFERYFASRGLIVSRVTK